MGTCCSSGHTIGSARHSYAAEADLSDISATAGPSGTAHSGRVSGEYGGERYTGLIGPQSPQLSYSQQCLVGVARWPDPQYNQEHTTVQMEYGLSFYNASRDLGQEIASGRIESFSQLWNRAREWRANVAGEDQEDFGEARWPTRHVQEKTPLTGPYAFIRDKFSDKEGEIYHQHEDGTYSMCFPLRENLNGSDMLLSRVIINSNPDKEKNEDSFARQVGHYDPFFISHTSSLNIEDIMNHVENLYNKAIDPHLSESGFMKKLAAIHWWTANAMPDKRGSAAKAELCVRAIAQARGMDLPPVRNGILADIEAMTTTRKEFVSRYSDFFD